YPAARLSSVTPTGGKAGSTAELTLTGTDLDGATDLVFSHPGIKAELTSAPVAVATAPAPNQPRNMAAQGTPTAAKVKVTIPSGTPPGVHDVRVVGKYGVTNPRAFFVSDLEEVLEKEPNNDVTDAQKVPLESAVTGVISTPTDVDYYAFEGKKGQRVVAHC